MGDINFVLNLLIKFLLICFVTLNIFFVVNSKGKSIIPYFIIATYLFFATII